MARPRVDELVRLMERAVSGNEHSLLDNIATVRDESWDALPPRAKHSIREITRHVGLFKYMYANHGFRDATMDYSDQPANPAPDRMFTPGTAAGWLREAHGYLRVCILELASDSELEALRKAHWGDRVPTYHWQMTRAVRGGMR